VTALLPKLSSLVLDKKLDELRNKMQDAIRLVGIVTVPASAFFLLFGERVAEAIFFGISEDSAIYIGRVLSAMALGLVPLSINLVLIRGLNAFENTKYQVVSNLVINLIALGISIAAALNLEARSVSVGLGIAFTASYWIGIFVTYLLLRRYTGALNLKGITLFYLRLALISALSVVSVAFIAQELELSGNIVDLIGVLATTSLLYLLFARAMKVEEVGQTIKVILRR
jgi:putative peptidoglycan lipid II flippase